MPAYTPQQRITKFWNKVEIKDFFDCWEWQGAQRKGYGKMTGFNGRVIATHRFAWELIHGPIPKGLQCLHTCDNRACVNPNHLYIGSHADNMRDRNIRNRQAKGSAHGRAKLTDDDVRKIKQLSAIGITAKALSSRFNVCLNTIYFIRRNQLWTHLRP